MLVPGMRRNDTINPSPYVAMLVLANSYGRVIAFYAAMDRDCIPPVGIKDLPVVIWKD